MCLLVSVQAARDVQAGEHDKQAWSVGPPTPAERSVFPSRLPRALPNSRQRPAWHEHPRVDLSANGLGAFLHSLSSGGTPRASVTGSGPPASHVSPGATPQRAGRETPGAEGGRAREVLVIVGP